MPNLLKHNERTTDPESMPPFLGGRKSVQMIVIRSQEKMPRQGSKSLWYLQRAENVLSKYLFIYLGKSDLKKQQL